MLREKKKRPHDLLSIYAGECKLIAGTILMLHHQVSKIVRGDISRRELLLYCTVLSVTPNYTQRLHQLFDHPPQHAA